MQSLILTLHIIVCVLLVILILLQAGKEGMGVIFGGGNTSVFGSTGAGGILVKLTTFMALIFVVTSLSYTYVTSSHQEKESTILDVQIEDIKPSEVKPEDATTAPTPQANPAGQNTNTTIVPAVVPATPKVDQGQTQTPVVKDQGSQAQNAPKNKIDVAKEQGAKAQNQAKTQVDTAKEKSTNAQSQAKSKTDAAKEQSTKAQNQVKTRVDTAKEKNQTSKETKGQTKEKAQ